MANLTTNLKDLATLVKEKDYRAELSWNRDDGWVVIIREKGKRSGGGVGRSGRSFGSALSHAIDDLFL